MTTFVRKRLLLVTVAAAGVLAACGDGGPSPAEYRERADEICADAEERFQNLEPPQNLEDLEAFVAEATDEMDRLIRRLRDLEAPEEVESQVETMLENLSGAVDQFPGLLEAAQAQDVERIQEIQTEIQRRVDRANQAAQEIGLDRCGSTSPTD